MMVDGRKMGDGKTAVLWAQYSVLLRNAVAFREIQSLIHTYARQIGVQARFGGIPCTLWVLRTSKCKHYEDQVHIVVGGRDVGLSPIKYLFKLQCSTFMRLVHPKITLFRISHRAELTNQV